MRGSMSVRSLIPTLIGLALALGLSQASFGLEVEGASAPLAVSGDGLDRPIDLELRDCPMPTAIGLLQACCQISPVHMGAAAEFPVV